MTHVPRLTDQPTATERPTRGADAPTMLAGAATLVGDESRAELIEAWVGLLRTIGEVLSDQVEAEEGEARVSRAIAALIPHDDMRVGRLDAVGRIFWLRKADHWEDDEYPTTAEDVTDPVVAAVLRDGDARTAEGRIVVPLYLGRRTTGVLDLRHRSSWTYQPRHLVAAQLLAEQIGPLVELMHLYKQEEVARRRLSSLIDISRAISHSLDLDTILPVIGRSLTEELNLPACAIFLREEVGREDGEAGEDGERLLPRVVVGEIVAGVAPDCVPTDQRSALPPIPLDAKFGPPLVSLRVPSVMDVPEEIRCELEDSQMLAPKRVLAVPLVVRDRLLGMAILPVVDDARRFGQATLETAMGIAQSAGIAIEHAQLYARARELGMAEERNRLAREVHDTLAQGLTAISLELDVVDRLLPAGAEARRRVGEARELARRALDEARRAVWGLTPLPLDGASLPDALAAEVARFSRRTGVQAQLVNEVDDSAAGAPLTDEQATALLRVAQEALHNAEKHAGATRVRVELRDGPAPGPLTLVIADDGRGFEHRASAGLDGGFGLSGMRERMRLIGGDLEVESAPGWGTRVRARLTLDPKRDATAPAPAEPAEPIRVLLVDDHPLAREGVRRLLEDREDVLVIGEADDGVEGVERALALRPDVVLMDLQMPRLSGVGAIQQLREAWPDARVLILTTFAQDEHLFEALRAGARGYLLKDAGPEALAAAIKTVHDGGSLVQPAMASRLLDRFGQLATRELLPEALTERELEILRLAAGGARNKEIADRLVISEKTVKNALSRLYAKLGASSRSEAVARGRALGVLSLDAAALVPEQ